MAMALRTTRALASCLRRGNQVNLTRGYAVATADQPRDIVKEKFIEKIKQYYGLLAEFKKFKIVIDPDDPKNVQEFSENLFEAYSNAGVPPIVDQVERVVNSFAAKSKTVREYYERLGRFQAERQIGDGSINKQMLAAIDKVESKIGKTLLPGDKEGMDMFLKESDAVLSKVGVKESELDKYVEQAKLDHAKYLLQEMKDKAIETMESYKRRDNLTDVEVDVKELDPRHLIRV